MHKLWFFFLKKRQFTWLLILALVGIGTYAVILIPKESAPEVVIPMGVVTTIYPGASAADMEELVTNKLESNFQNLSDLKQITSVSQDGVSTIQVEFNPNANVDKSIQNIKDEVDKTKNDLPANAQTPIVSKINFADQPIHVISISSSIADPVAFARFGDELKNIFKTVPGVSKVIVSGTRPRQVQVVVSEASLATYGLTINNITNALQSANVSVPVGIVHTAGVSYSIRFNGDIKDPAVIKTVPIKTVNGTQVTIGDVAAVYDGVSPENTISRVSVNGKPSERALSLTIYKQSGYDVTTMSKAVHAKVDELERPGGLLANSQVLFTFDQGAQVKKDLGNLVEAGMETVVLVILMLLLTIGWRESIVAALSIPLSFVIAFIGLYLSGNTINFISLFALILAVGILVDSGIVITEAIHTRITTLKDPTKAAHAAIEEYAWPLIGGTMTTIAVFAPLFFLSGVTGKFIASIPFTIIFVLLASIFVALGLVPLIAIMLSKTEKHNRFEQLQEVWTHKIQVWYRARLVSFLQNRVGQRIFLWTLFIAFIGALALPSLGMLKVVFFPSDNVDYLYVNIQAKQGTPVQRTDLAVRQVEEVLYGKPYIESFTSTAGAGSSFVQSSQNENGGKYGNITIKLKSDRTQTSDLIANDLRTDFSKITDAKVSIEQQSNGPPSGAPVVIKFLGNDLNELSVATNKASNLLHTIPGARNITESSDANATEYLFTVDKQKASALGVSSLAIAQTLRTAVFGTKATTLRINGTDVDVMVKLAVGAPTNDPSAPPTVTMNDLDNLTVMSTRGVAVPLGSVVKQRLAPANTAITHEDTRRVEKVSAYVDDSTTASDVVAAFKSQIGALNLPSDITVSYGGDTQNINQTFTEMFVALIVGLLLMLGILVLVFNSVRYSLYLLLAVPYSLIGVFFGLAATGLALSFTSLLGVIALAGVIINHAIILMDSMITHKASTYTGSDTLLDQVADAAVSRLRPIILTTIVTVVGMIPLSRISSLWGPLAFAIMFGLTFAMVLTLVLVPTLFYRAELRKEQRRLRDRS